MTRSDVWLADMNYRVAVTQQARVWTGVSHKLADLFSKLKDIEVERRQVWWGGVGWGGVGWGDVVWHGLMWCGVVWCGVVWCGVVWCYVVWCGVAWFY